MKAKSLIKKIFNIFLTVLFVLLVAIIILTIVARFSGNTPSIGGYMIFRVSSGSMEPDLKIGDVLLSKEVTDITSLNVGDIVTYHGTSANLAGKPITHQVVKGPYEENGTYYLVTKGTANLEEDPPITEEQLVGVMICKIPLINELYNFFLTPWGLITAILLIILAFSGEFWNIYKLSHEKEDLPEVSEETIQKALEEYTKEKEAEETKEEFQTEPEISVTDEENINLEDTDTEEVE